MLRREYMPFAGPDLEDPYAYHAYLRREAPVSYHASLGMWVVARHEDICAVLRDPARFSSTIMGSITTELSPEARAILAEGYPVGKSLLNLDPPSHTKLRRLMNHGFTQSRIALLEPRIRAVTRELVDAFIGDGRADLVEQFAYPLPVLVILGMVGVPREDMARIKQWSDDMFSLFFTKVPPEAQPAVCRSMVEYQRYTTALIEQRRREPREDLASYLVAAEPGGEALDLPDLIFGICGSLLAAGHETTTSLIATAMRHLLSHPQHWEALKEDRSLIPKVIEEVLRYVGITHGMMRATNEDVVLGGVAIPKGAHLLLLYLSGSRDEAQFPHADVFDPRREKQDHLAFGRGIHYCLGAPLARLEMQIALEILLERIPEMRLVPGQNFEPTQSLVLRSMKHLRVEWPAAQPRA
jgi:cytochrome P450